MRTKGGKRRLFTHSNHRIFGSHPASLHHLHKRERRCRNSCGQRGSGLSQESCENYDPSHHSDREIPLKLHHHGRHFGIGHHHSSDHHHESGQRHRFSRHHRAGHSHGHEEHYRLRRCHRGATQESITHQNSRRHHMTRQHHAYFNHHHPPHSSCERCNLSCHTGFSIRSPAPLE